MLVNIFKLSVFLILAAFLLPLPSWAEKNVEDLVQKAAAGNADAQNRLGIIYYVHGEFERANRWYVMAANQGHAGAQYNLGVVYDKGQGVKKNTVEAKKWHNKSTEPRKNLFFLQAGEIIFFFFCFFFFFLSYYWTRKRTRKRQEKIHQEQRARFKQQYKKEPSINRSTPDKIYKDILGLDDEFTVDDIKKQYRKFVKEYHPDNVMNLGEKIRELAEEEMKKINAAYEYFRVKYNFR
ncbi:MAG: hypothetical protein D3923_11710 [Candidatus Electrothrix sp. AR3]|nr:hypothetical protein [Candidatus Electrothrix sp. AR3]